ILPAYALAGLDGVKAFLGALGGLTAAVMVLLAYRATGSLGAALGAAVCLGVSAPIFIYSTQIYPESPAALIVAVCMWLSLGARPGWRSAALLALGLNGLVWLGSKYALVGAAVGLTALVRLRPSARWVLPALLIPSTAYYTWFHLATYGGLTPYAVNRVYAGNDTITTVAMHLELWNRVYRFAGLWIDGEFGIVRWAPVVLLVVVAAPRMARQAGPLRWALPLVFGAQLLVAVFVSITMRGWWFPGRMLIVVLPLLAVPLAFALLMARGRPAPAGAAALLGGAGLALTLALREAAAAEQVVLAVDPFALAWPPFQATAALFPVYSSYTPATWLLTAAWAIAAAGLLGLGFRLSAPTCGNAADEPETASPGPPVTKQG
ncbi:MAG: hypothetical protein NTZ05_14075, partial [Chloroflexi bacterium]|nr:hypothetical protein [Chloroflexota bacterium]